MLSIIQLHRANSERAHVLESRNSFSLPRQAVICITAFLATKTPSVNLYSSLWNILKALRNVTNGVSLLILFQDKLFLSDISASVQQCLLSSPEPRDYSHANNRHILNQKLNTCLDVSIQEEESDSAAQWVMGFAGGKSQLFWSSVFSPGFPIRKWLIYAAKHFTEIPLPNPRRNTMSHSVSPTFKYSPASQHWDKTAQILKEKENPSCWT